MRYLFFMILAWSQCELSSWASTETIIVLNGGFSSCPDSGLADKVIGSLQTHELYENIFQRKIVSKIRNKTGKNPHIFSTCYTGPSSLLNNFAKQFEARYTWNHAHLDEYGSQFEFGIPQGAMLQDVSFLNSFKLSIRQYIIRNFAKDSNIEMYFIGHSYGGFTSIQLADYFSAYLKGLVTLDPISMINCQAKLMATDLLKTLAARHKGCRSYPTDSYSTRSSRKLHNMYKKDPKSFWWHHFYQESFPWLHSSQFKISGAHLFPANTRLRFRILGIPAIKKGFHSEMARHEAVWERISNRF